MKKLKLSIKTLLSSTMILMLLILVSCEKNAEVNSENEVPKQKNKTEQQRHDKAQNNFENYDIRYLNAAGDYVSITEQQLKNFVINQFDLSADLNFDFVEVVVNNNKVEHALLQAEFGNGDQGQFGVLLDSLEGYENLYLISNKQCTCRGCPNGCSLSTSGGNCYCSPCPFNEPCTKTETASTGNYAIYAASDFECC